MINIKKDLTGKRFGWLTVISRSNDITKKNGEMRSAWLCKCDCGKTVIVAGVYLNSGNTKSCGCHKRDGGGHPKTHGDSKKRLYRIWNHIKQRCLSENNPHYKDYGGRGIDLCVEWMEYSIFKDWAMQNGYEENLTIDRINNDDGYKPSNCRWVNQITQTNNMRSNRRITFNNETHTLAEWSRITGIPYARLSARLSKSKWTIERSLTEIGNACYKKGIENPCFGRKCSEQEKFKISKSLKGTHMGKENKNAKGVVQIEKNTSKVIHYFDSIADAARDTLIRDTSIRAACHGRAKTAGGYIWKLVSCESKDPGELLPDDDLENNTY